MGIIGGLKETYRTTKRYGELTESPRDRLYALAFDLFAGRELPNIILGGAISATIAVLVGTAPALMAALAWLAWVLSVVNYMVAQEAITAYHAASQRFDTEHRGIH